MPVEILPPDGQGFRCAVIDCPILHRDGVNRQLCPEPEMLCEYVRCSIDPEDMPTFEEWAVQQFMTEKHMINKAALAATALGCGVRVDRRGLLGETTAIMVDPAVPAGELHEHWSRS